jgi:hypothetical protein
MPEIRSKWCSADNGIDHIGYFYRDQRGIGNMVGGGAIRLNVRP